MSGKPVLQIIIASTRPGRAGLPVASWFTARAQADGRFDVQVTDLAELALPFMDEPNHPRLRQYTHEHTKAWSAVIDGSDAIVVVVPEYNYSYPAPLKNALDYLNHEWANKPIGYVSYGGVAAGTRSVAALQPVMNALRLRPAVATVSIPFVANLIGDDHQLQANDVMKDAATAMLEELSALDAALAPLRGKQR